MHLSIQKQCLQQCLLSAGPRGGLLEAGQTEPGYSSSHLDAIFALQRVDHAGSVN